MSIDKSRIENKFVATLNHLPLPFNMLNKDLWEKIILKKITEHRDRIAFASVNKAMREEFYKQFPYDMVWALMKSKLERKPCCSCDYGCYGHYYDIYPALRIFSDETQFDNNIVLKHRNIFILEDVYPNKFRIRLLNALKTDDWHLLEIENGVFYYVVIRNRIEIVPEQIRELLQNKPEALKFSQSVYGWLSKFLCDWSITRSLISFLSDCGCNCSSCMMFLYCFPVLASLEIVIKVVSGIIGFPVYGVARLSEYVESRKITNLPNENSPLLGLSFFNSSGPKKIQMSDDEKVELGMSNCLMK